MQVYSAAAVHAALPWAALAQALQAAFVRGAQVPVRHTHALSARDTLLLMPAWDDELLIHKLVTVIPGAASTVQATVSVFERASGHPLAVLDGEAVTLRRTAAASALAARVMAAPSSRHLLIVGAGRLAPWMARAHLALRPQLSQVVVWGRRAPAARALVAELAAQGLPARAADDLESAVRDAHIVCCATTSTEPLVRSQWLAPGTHLDLVGGFRPDMREVDDDTVVRARIVVDTRAGALQEAGDLVQPRQRGLIDASSVVGELAELLRGQCEGRTHPEQVTLFKSVGTALEDLAAARLIIKSSKEQQR